MDYMNKSGINNYLYIHYPHYFYLLNDVLIYSHVNSSAQARMKYSYENMHFLWEHFKCGSANCTHEGLSSTVQIDC